LPGWAAFTYFTADEHGAADPDPLGAAAAKAIVSIAPSVGLTLSCCSCVQALSKLNSSARLRCRPVRHFPEMELAC
jgi:hypothetical protein